MDHKLLCFLISKKLGWDFLDIFNPKELEIIYHDMLIFDTSQEFFYQNLVLQGFHHKKILELCNPNKDKFLMEIIKKDINVFQYFINNNVLTNISKNIVSNLLFLYYLDIWITYKFENLKLDECLKFELSEIQFKYLYNNYDLMIPQYYYYIWKYNNIFIKLLLKPIDISYFYNFIDFENPLVENDINYLKFLRTKIKSPIISNSAIIFKKLCDCNSEYQIWEFFLSITTKISISQNILTLKNYQIKDLVIKKFLSLHNIIILKSNLLKSIKLSTYTTVPEKYIQNTINIDDCIQVFQKYFPDTNLKFEDFVTYISRTPNYTYNKTQKSYGKYIFENLTKNTIN